MKEQILCVIVPTMIGTIDNPHTAPTRLDGGCVEILSAAGPKFLAEWIGQGGDDTATLLEGAPDPPGPGIWVYEVEPVDNDWTGGHLFPDGRWRDPLNSDHWDLVWRVPR